MFRPTRAIIGVLGAIAGAGCGATDVVAPEAAVDSVQKESAVPNISADPGASFVVANAALRRITMDEFLDFTIDIDLSTLGGFDLQGASPPSDIEFCEAASTARIAWIDSGVLAVQYWHDAFAASGDVPAEVRTDVDLLLEHTAQRIAWNLRRADEPTVDTRVADAAHRVVTAAIDACPDLAAVIGQTEQQLRMPWAEGSAADLDPNEACATDLDEVNAGIDRYVELRGTAPVHLEQVEAALLADGSVYFFGSVLHVIVDGPSRVDAQPVVEPIAVGPCAASG